MNTDYNMVDGLSVYGFGGVLKDASNKIQFVMPFLLEEDGDHSVIDPSGKIIDNKFVSGDALTVGTKLVLQNPLLYIEGMGLLVIGSEYLDRLLIFKDDPYICRYIEEFIPIQSGFFIKLSDLIFYKMFLQTVGKKAIKLFDKEFRIHHGKYVSPLVRKTLRLAGDEYCENSFDLHIRNLVLSKLNYHNQLEYYSTMTKKPVSVLENSVNGYIKSHT